MPSVWEAAAAMDDYFAQRRFAAEHDCYVYLYSRLDGSPAYVGIGRGRRWLAHMRRCKNVGLAAVIEEYRRAGRAPDVVKLRTNITMAEAAATEIALIAHFGSVLDGTGCLVNASVGGEGSRRRCKSKAKAA
jgi:hypothetical protein